MSKDELIAFLEAEKTAWNIAVGLEYASSYHGKMLQGRLKAVTEQIEKLTQGETK